MNTTNIVHGYMTKKVSYINSDLRERSKPRTIVTKNKKGEIVKIVSVKKKNKREKDIHRPNVCRVSPILSVGYWCMLLYFLIKLF